MNKQEFINFVKSSHISQLLFTQPASDATKTSDYVSSERASDIGRTGLDEEVIAPRTMVAILNKLKSGGQAVTIDQGTSTERTLLGTTLAEILTDFVDGIKSENDRAVITKLFETHGLIIPA
jgi:hypothetical protein